MKIIFLIVLVFIGNLVFAQTPIAYVQGEQEASPLAGQEVTIKGIVTASKSGSGYFLQDGDSAWTGIFIYEIDRSPMPEVGDEVQLTGEVTEYYGLTEIKNISAFEVISSGNQLPFPIMLKTGEVDESYEGVFVKVVDAECTTVSLGYGEWEVNDGSGTAVINDVFFAFTPTKGMKYNITGSLDYSFDFYKIEPRSANDIIINAPVYFVIEPYQVNLSKTSITIDWETNTAATSEVKYGKTVALEMGVIKNEELKTDHEIILDDLEAGELYYVKAYSILLNDTTPRQIKSYTTISNSSGEMKVVFTSPLYQLTTGASECLPAGLYYTNNMADTIVKYINKAQNTLDIAIYDVVNYSTSSDNTNQIIFDAVKAKASSGVKVRVITDDESTDIFFTDLLSNANVMWGNTDAIMHHKFIVIDAANEQESWIVTGSVNWTYNNLVMDANNLISIQDRSLAKAYTAEFNEMWGGSQDVPDYTKGIFGSLKKDNTPHLFEIGGKNVELFFSPSDHTESQIIEAFNTADHEIAFNMMAFTSDGLGAAIKAAYDRGVAIKGVIDYVEYTGSEFDMLVKAGVDVVDFSNPDGGSWPNAMTIHHKYAVIDYNHPDSDPMVITGTHNWTASADSRNDENTLIIHDADLPTVYSEEVNLVYSMSNLSNAVETIETGLTIYPNPAYDIINITTISASKSYMIFNKSGQLVTCGTPKQTNVCQIDVSAFEKGLYVVIVEVEKGQAVHSKFVIE